MRVNLTPMALRSTLATDIRGQSLQRPLLVPLFQADKWLQSCSEQFGQNQMGFIHAMTQMGVRFMEVEGTTDNSYLTFTLKCTWQYHTINTNLNPTCKGLICCRDPEWEWGFRGWMSRGARGTYVRFWSLKCYCWHLLPCLNLLILNIHLHW